MSEHSLGYKSKELQVGLEVSLVKFSGNEMV